jgi:hypothetical protein
MAKTFWAGIVLFAIFGATAPAAKADEQEQTPKQELQNADEIFSSEYLERINASKQAEEEQSRVDRSRHQKALDFWMSRNR